METWRLRLFLVVLAGTSLGYGALYVSAEAALRESLHLLLAVFLVGMLATALYKRRELTGRLVTANLALGSLVHLAVAGLLVTADRLWVLGVVPAVEGGCIQFVVGGLGILAASLTWTRARRRPAAPDVPATPTPEPAPPPLPELEREADWRALAAQLAQPEHRRQLQVLQRVDAALADPSDTGQARRVVRQEALRLAAHAAAQARDSADEDLLSQAASLVEWGAQKVPELAELDMSDLLMAKAIADIRALSSGVTHTFVDHRRLLAIHPIDRATADDKCNQRAEAARAALPLLRSNSLQLSEALIAGHDELASFRSVTGFQVVEVPEGFVTFEGNGRREALARAFGNDQGVQVEVRLYRFDDPEVAVKIARRVQRVRRWKGVAD